MKSSESKAKSELVLVKNLNFNHKQLKLIELFVQEVQPPVSTVNTASSSAAWEESDVLKLQQLTLEKN